MSHETTTLAEWVSHGWNMGLFCARCRKPIAGLTGEDIMTRFGANLLATVGDLCARTRCPACGHLGAWESGMAGVSPEIALRCRTEARIGNWLARDLYLRQMLADHGRPLEIADFVWERIEAFGSGHPDWAPRQPEREGCPLSSAGAAAISAVGSESPAKTRRSA